jgi:cytochrome b561/polyisoprenoid-binding protein YceI
MIHAHAQRSAAAEYSAVAKALHWLIAAFILAQIPLGLIMTEMQEANLAAAGAHQASPYPVLQVFNLYQLHKSMGVTVLGLVLLRLLWRFASPPPSLPASMPWLEREGAKAAHLLLYALMFALPLTGWALVSVETRTPIPTILYRTVPWPHIPFLATLPKDEKNTLHALFDSAHSILGWILLAAVVIHVVAALRHGLILKDGVMSRMLPRVLRKSRSVASGFFVLLGAAALLLAAQPAFAENWSILPEKSSISFTANAGGSEYKGTIRDYKAEVMFDPDAPKTASVKLIMATSGLTFGRSDYDEAVQGAEWFDVKTYPQAMFIARDAEVTGDNQYTFNGQLTLKGMTKPVPVQAAIGIKEGEAHVTGAANISRAAFGIGPASFAGIPVSDEVKITFDLTAMRLDN